MNNHHIESRIRNTDWSEYLGPEYFSPDELIESLIDLNNYDTVNAEHGLDNKVLFAVGNNHAGTYYPAILSAVDIIIEIERSSDIEPARKCANAILNDLYYFQPELGSYNKHSYEQIEKIIKEKLEPYSDEA